ncbi:MAG: response regulator [Candidatus Latescibacteria bacterium]|nr:response regulator [Candidatus Latescibacterota bacterium]
MAQITPREKVTVLIVNDEEDTRFVLKNLLDHWEYQPIIARDANEALEILRKHTPLVVLSDIEIPGINGLQLLQIIKQQYPQVPVIMMSGRGTAEEDAKRSLELGAFQFIPKPFDLKYLRQVLSAVQLFSRPCL